MSNKPDDLRENLKWQRSSGNLAHRFCQLQEFTTAQLSEQPFRSLLWNSSDHDEDSALAPNDGSRIWI
jgi:hypothetical protein